MNNKDTKFQRKIQGPEAVVIAVTLPIFVPYSLIF